jgi:Domain of unknown function (DUF4265)
MNQNGEISRHPQTKSTRTELVKLCFKLDDSDAAMGVETESLWALPLEDYNTFKIDNIPFYIYGVSNEDIVSATKSGSIFEFQQVILRGGHSTYRVLVTDLTGFESDIWKARWTNLAVLGCSCEIAKTRWIAIDVPKFSNVDEVYALLVQGETDGAWIFEEGHCGHPI